MELGNMKFMDDLTLEKRNHVIQEVIDLTVVNGRDYLKKLEAFNRKFKPNTKTRILYHEELKQSN